MTNELQTNGSLYDWFVRQFWRLRYVGTGIIVRHRIIQQLGYVQKCIEPDRIPKPAIRAAKGPVKLAIKEETDYNSQVAICARLKPVAHAAVAEYDSYTAQWGFSGRLSTPEEEEAQRPSLPAIISATIAGDLPTFPSSYPRPVTAADDVFIDVNR
eukprot:13460932-Heterocapsa_arctica.AAC.1